MKLEGKTLVNLGGKINKTTSQYDQILKSCRLLNPNSIYTFVLVNKGVDAVNVYTNENVFTSSESIMLEPNKIVIFTRSTLNKVSEDILLKAHSVGNVSYNIDVVVLEGDHTQNPPSYFEGLKSVGQDVDEIVVSSVNENLFDINSDVRYQIKVYEKNKCILSYEEHTTKMEVASDKLLVNFVQWRGLCFGVWLKPNTSYEISFDKSGDAYSNLIDGRNTKIVTTDSKGKAYWMFEPSSNGSMILSNIMVKETSVATNNHIPHQADKKRLLYYNNETQAWEKPILRQWDSIEKHSDGKYYYHKRSGEVVLNGSENWTGATQTGNLNQKYIPRHDMIRLNDYAGRILCDKFEVLNSYYTAKEGISGYTSVGSYIGENWIYINTPKSTEELKQWLKANPTTVVYQLAQEEVYECANLDLITYANETNYVVNTGAITPKSSLKVIQNAANIIKQLQEKVSVLEGNQVKFMQIILDIINKE